MLKKVICFTVLLIFIAVMPAGAAGIDYINNQDLTEENALDFKTLSLLVKTYSDAGNDTSELESKISAQAVDCKLDGQAYALLAANDPALVEEIASKQKSNGSWGDRVYSTALISYSLLENNLEVGSAKSGLTYLETAQSENGSWNGSVQDTALSLLALSAGDFYGEAAQKALNWLLHQQGGDAGWGSNINTAWAVLALMETGIDSELLAEPTAEAVELLKLNMNSDGGRGIFPGQSSDPFTSALVLWGLQEYDDSLEEVREGLIYINNLISNKVWINRAFTFYNISEINYILKEHPQYSQIGGKYDFYLTSFSDQENNDYLARKIIIEAENSNDIMEELQELIQMQNDDGGWGFTGIHESNSWDTVLALRALTSAGYDDDLTVYQYALNYLHNQQNADGSFSIKKEDEGHLYLTSLIIEQLAVLESLFDLSFIITPAENWLLSCRKNDGSYGESLLEDSKAFSVTFDKLNIDQAKQTFDYLNENQKLDGSWANDSLTTAAVLAALNKVKADLSVSSENICFTPEEIYANEEVSIEIEVENFGYKTCRDVDVRFYQDELIEENLIYTGVISEILPGDKKRLEFGWHSGSAHVHTFYLVVDPDNKIEELEDSNNKAAKAVSVIPKVDLTLTEEDIWIIPEDPGSTDILTITAEAHNRGRTACGEFDITFYSGDPKQEGVVLETVSCPGIEALDSKKVSIETKLPEGNYQIFVSLDTDNFIEEDIEDNNTAAISLTIKDRIDLAVSHRDILFSDDEPVEGDSIVVYAAVSNKREQKAEEVPVSLYLGDPDEEGELIGAEIIKEIDGYEVELVSWNLDTSGLTGRNTLYVVVDPENTISEVNKNNNKAANIIYVEEEGEGSEVEGIDLSIKGGDLYYTPYRPSILENITFYIKVNNTGSELVEDIPAAIYAGDPDDGGILLTTLAIPKLEAGECSLEKYTWDPSDHPGEQTIYAVVDPDNTIDEINENNNSTSIDIVIAESSVLLTNISGIDSKEFPYIEAAVQVNDDTGNGVAGLRKNNFILIEDGVEQDIINVRSLVDEGTVIPRVDVVFVIDTSGSMGPVWDSMGEVLINITDEMIRMGIDLDFKIYSMNRYWSSAASNIPTNEVLNKGIYDGNTINISTECWGPASFWIAENHDWREEAYRVIVPVADEHSYRGGLSPDSYDNQSSAEVKDICHSKNVEVYPIYHDYYYSQSRLESVVQEMTDIAESTGGLVFHFEDAGQISAELNRMMSIKKVNYYLEYESSNKIKDGTIRNVSIEAYYRGAEGSGDGQYQAPQDIYSDLAAVDLTSNHISHAGQLIEFTGTVENIGGISAENIRADIYLGDPDTDGIYLDSKLIDELDVNEMAQVEFNWTAAAGIHEIYMVIDPENMIEETDISNNIISLECRVPGQEYPDLFVLESEFSLEEEILFTGQLVKIRLRVRNGGSESLPTMVGIYEGHPAEGGRLISSMDLGTLSYLAYHDLETYWVTGQDVGEKDIYVIVDPFNKVEESNKENNMVYKTVNIIERNLKGEILTDKEIYNVEEDVCIDVHLENYQDIDWKSKARIVIKDHTGNEVEELAEYDIKNLPAEVDGIPGFWEDSLMWNTGSSYAGTYLACMQLYVYDDQYAEYLTEFEINANYLLKGNLYTNKTVYSPVDEAEITVEYSNESLNTTLENCSLEVSVSNTAGEEVWNQEEILSYLLPSTDDSLIFYWPILDNAGGEYMVNAVISIGQNELWTAEKTITVEEKCILAGELTVEPQMIKKDVLVNFDYSIQNRGNRSLEEFTTEIILIDEAYDQNLDQVSAVFNYTNSISAGERIEDYQNEIVDLNDGYYMVILQAEVDGEIQSLDSSRLIVDSTPPKLNIEIEGKKWCDGWFKSEPLVKIKAEDEISGVKAVYYKLGSDDNYKEYKCPFKFEKEGITKLYVYAVDNNDNYVEEIKKVRFALPWPASFSLLSQSQLSQGEIRIDRSFSNGEVTLYGNCHFDYLGTANCAVDKYGEINIETLETNAPYYNLPEPDWEALNEVTKLKQEQNLTNTQALSNVRFENDVNVYGVTKFEGLLVVDGDLTIYDQSDLIDVGIFCTGKVLIAGNIDIEGLIYAGEGIEILSQVNVRGAVAADGKAKIAGNFDKDNAAVGPYLKYLKNMNFK